jgi:hypothetical protein
LREAATAPQIQVQTLKAGREVRRLSPAHHRL